MSKEKNLYKYLTTSLHVLNFNDFGAKFASTGDFFVQACHSQGHRGNSSIAITPNYFPGKSVFSYDYLKEKGNYSDIRGIIKDPNRNRPVNLVIAGVKIETGVGVISKITVTKKLINDLRERDRLTIAGALAYTFIIAQDMKTKGITDPGKMTDEDIKALVGDSIWQRDLLADALEILTIAEKKGIDLRLPKDHLATDGVDKNGKIVFEGKKLAENAQITKVTGNISPGNAGVGLGDETIEYFTEGLDGFELILIAGPLDVFEDERTNTGSMKFIKKMAQVTEKGVRTIAMGGDTEVLVSNAGVGEDLSFISLSGGAGLEDIEKEGDLPATIAVLNNAPHNAVVIDSIAHDNIGAKAADVAL